MKIHLYRGIGVAICGTWCSAPRVANDTAYSPLPPSSNDLADVTCVDCQDEQYGLECSRAGRRSQAVA